LVILSLNASISFAGSCGSGNHGHTKQEVAEKYFGQMDLNNDQVIDRSEFVKSPMSKMIKSFEVLQPDATGVVRKEAFITFFVKAHSDHKTAICVCDKAFLTTTIYRLWTN
jgi:hypothetical protein